MVYLTPYDMTSDYCRQTHKGTINSDRQSRGKLLTVEWNDMPCKSMLHVPI